MRKALLVVLFSTFVFSSCTRSAEPYTETELRMDTVCSITVYDEDDRTLISGAFDIIDDVVKLIDIYDSSSEIYHLNENAAKESVSVSPELFALIRRAYDMSVLTDGAFNIAIGPLVELWGIGNGGETVPSAEDIEKTLLLTDYNNIILDEENRSVLFLKEGMKIDLGALGKGYAADRIAEYFRENGVENAIINLGGNVYMLGSHPEGREWTVGLQSPDTERGGYFATVACSDSSVVTSGGYERYFETEDGNIYHHILSSKTGYPASSDIVSSSIISRDSTLADMLSTATFVLGSKKGEEIVNQFSLQAVFLLENGDVKRIGI